MKNTSVATSYDDLTISSVTFLSMQPFSTRNYMYYSFLTVWIPSTQISGGIATGEYLQEWMGHSAFEWWLCLYLNSTQWLEYAHVPILFSCHNSLFNIICQSLLNYEKTTPSSMLRGLWVHSTGRFSACYNINSFWERRKCLGSIANSKTPHYDFFFSLPEHLISLKIKAHIKHELLLKHSFTSSHLGFTGWTGRETQFLLPSFPLSNATPTLSHITQYFMPPPSLTLFSH